MIIEYDRLMEEELAELQPEEQTEEQGSEQPEESSHAEPLGEQEAHEDKSEEDDDAFVIELENEHGELESRRIMPEQLQKFLHYVDNPNSMPDAEEYEKTRALANELQEKVQTLEKSELLRDILYYSKQGYTDEQIARGIAELAQSQKQQYESDEYLSDEQREINNLKNELAQIKSSTESSRAQQLYQQTAASNDQVLIEAIEKNSYVPAGEKPTRKDLEIMEKAYLELYPSQPYQSTPLNKSQAEMVVRLAKEKKAAEDGSNRIVKKIDKNRQAPNIMPGGAGQRQYERLTRKVDGVSRNEKKKRLRDVLGN